jgi:uncharacterized membrane protein YgdD (TMEM256/DUF423 family)
MPMMRRLLIVFAGLVGAAGVAAAAAASHDCGRNLAALSTICLAHGPALLALGLAGRGRVLLAAAGVLALGTALFCADLAMREYLGHGLFSGAAPLGGGAMLLGWLGVALGGMFLRRPAQK